MTVFSVRPFLSADFSSLLSVENRSFAHPQTQGQLEVLLNRNNPCWIAKADDGLVGFVIMRSVVDEAEILDIAVLPDFHGQGVAQQLLLQSCGFLRDNGVLKLFLEVRISNLRAIAFYQKLGFSGQGKRSQYYINEDGGHEDALIMLHENLSLLMQLCQQPTISCKSAD